MTALDGAKDFRAVLRSDRRLQGVVSDEAIDGCFDLAQHTQHVDEVFKRVGLGD